MVTHIMRRLLLQKRYYSKEAVSFSKVDFVPSCLPPTALELEIFQEFIDNSKRLFVMTGAGVSTESGIPDYRSEGVGLYARSKNRPVQYQDFIKKPEIRQRYWARNFVGWPTFSTVLPNQTHDILSVWEKSNKVHWLVTQNVDALHYKAGHQNLTELHGSAHRVECIDCGNRLSRTLLQEMIQRENPAWRAEIIDIAPDGDVQLDAERIKTFKVPLCKQCGGIIKPEIVFFGDNVPRSRVNDVHERLKESDSLLVLGSSLQVFSGFRFVKAAQEQNKPIAIVNIGETRADKLADIKISAKCSTVLQSIYVSS